MSCSGCLLSVLSVRALDSQSCPCLNGLGSQVNFQVVLSQLFHCCAGAACTPGKPIPNASISCCVSGAIAGANLLSNPARSISGTDPTGSGAWIWCLKYTTYTSLNLIHTRSNTRWYAFNFILNTRYKVTEDRVCCC